MVDLKKPVYVNLAEAIRKTVSAHDAVYRGIATHAEKHRVEQEAKRQKLEMAAPLPARSDNAIKAL